MNCLHFENDEAKKDANFYLDTKGVAIHLRIAQHLGYAIDDEAKKIDWLRVSSLLRYDKKLRDKIYIYLATLEEYIRAYISNTYEDEPKQGFWIKKKEAKHKDHIFEKVGTGEKVSTVLEGIDFGKLIEQVMALPSKDKIELFGQQTELDKNLDAVRKLRNAVSHHAFLRGYEFSECMVDEKLGNSLEHNIKNLRQLLPESYRYGKNGSGGITADIEKCRFEYIGQNEKKTKQEMLLTDKDIVKLQ